LSPAPWIKVSGEATTTLTQGGPLFKRFEGHKGLRAELRAADWLQHLRVGAGVGDVRTIPYYLMIVGNPQALPFGVEFDLAGSSYAVGRSVRTSRPVAAGSALANSRRLKDARRAGAQYSPAFFADPRS